MFFYLTKYVREILIKLPPYTHLIVALFFLLFTVLLSAVDFDFFASSPDSYAQEVSANLRREFDIAHSSLTDFKSQLAAQPLALGFFDKLTYRGKYPIFIYRNDEIIYWTDHKYAIDPENLTGKFAEFVIESGNGVYAVIKEHERIAGERVSLVVVIPIYQRYKIDNQYLKKTNLNPDIFPDDKVSISISYLEGKPIKSGDGRYLFSIVFPENYSYAVFLSQKDLLLICIALTILFALLQIRGNLLEYIQHQKIWEGLVWLMVSLSSIRLLMLLFNFPSGLTKHDLFNAKIYASSIIAPSLGDLFLNILFLFVISGYIYLYHHQLFNYRIYSHYTLAKKIAIAIIFTLGTIGVLHLQYVTLETIYFNSQIRLDITSNLTYDILKVTCLLIFVMSSFIYFFISHVSSHLLLAINFSQKQILVSIILASLIYLITSLFLKNFSYVVLLLNAFYLSAITFLKFFRNIRLSSYFTYIYLFFIALTSALLGAYSNYIFEGRMDIAKKEKFANRILIGNDKLGEFLLSEAVKKIQEDQIISTRMLSSLAPIDLVVQKIKRQHLADSYFDKYDLNILLFNSNGQPYNYDLPYDSLWIKYNVEKYRTEDPHTFFINDLPANAKRYLSFISIKRKDMEIGKIILDLKSKKVVPNNVYPRLFLDRRFANYYEEENLSYAIYKNGKLWDSFGSFSYDNSFLNEFKDQDPESELVINNHRHFLVRGSDERQVIVTSTIYPLKNIISNFSFLFLLLLLFKVPLALLYEWCYRHSDLHFSFSSRIQLYLNIAFFLPLLIVSVLIISILNSDNKSTIQEEYIKVAENVAVNLSREVEEYQKNIILREQLLNKLSELARFTQTEISLFGKKGKLIGASNPTIYENNLLSELINPAALTQILQEHQSRVMLTESIGSLEYNSVYASIKSAEGELLGIIGLPFFESQRKSEEQIINILSTILNVFTFTFLGLLVLSYFASQVLTEPLRMITQRLKGTNLNIHNEPLDYKSDDEIGLLVGAYNKMLVQLEESKEALSKSEKESAWREMAKQVAHEIKNPLTPMKLTLQHIKRVIGEENPRLNMSLETLLTQIDILSDIATSFSSFANMPIPKNEEFEITEVLKQTVDLYENDGGNAKILLNMIEGKYYVNGDKQLMGRILTNLIINGIQAVPNTRTPEIVIFFRLSGTHNVLIEIADNGIGIAESIRHKVFLPNFSTKFTGSGIGLALAKRGIEHADGKIWFETEEGEGTSFFIELPLIRYQASEKEEFKLVLQ
ncbi:sensor histidine kinase [Thermoflexibacter ruber]|nr:HAMP domain-containing sensor histidine kinase [Thermoflexibacter ruber]